MRIYASNGKGYDPDTAQLIGKKVFPDGSVQRLHRTKNGVYFFFETSVANNTKTVVPSTYDNAIEWAEKYGDKEMVYAYMKCDVDQLRHYTVKLKECDLSRLELIAKKERLTVKDTLQLIALQYDQMLNGGDTVEEE